MANKTQDKILLIVGRLEGKVDGISQRLDRVNGTLINHGKRINRNESAIDRAKGKATLAGGMAGFAISIIGLIFAWLRLKK